LCFFSPLEFSIEIILSKYFTVSKTACFEPLSEVAVLHHRAAVRHFKTASGWSLRYGRAGESTIRQQGVPDCLDAATAGIKAYDHIILAHGRRFVKNGGRRFSENYKKP
jgi:hypothetical protein